MMDMMSDLSCWMVRIWSGDPEPVVSLYTLTLQDDLLLSGSPVLESLQECALEVKHKQRWNIRNIDRVLCVMKQLTNVEQYPLPV